jgi:hypothetical protein
MGAQVIYSSRSTRKKGKWKRENGKGKREKGKGKREKGKGKREKGKGERLFSCDSLPHADFHDTVT